MKTEKIENLLSQARFAHPTDEELGQFEDGALIETAHGRIRAHLDLCPICERRLALLREALATPATETPSPRMAEFIQNLVSEPKVKPGNILVLAELAENIRSFEFTAEALAAETKSSGDRELWRWEGSDKATSAHVVLREDGRLVFRLGSNDSTYENQPFILRIGRWRHRGKLERWVRGVLAEVELPNLKNFGGQSQFALEFPAQDK